MQHRLDLCNASHPFEDSRCRFPTVKNPLLVFYASWSFRKLHDGVNELDFSQNNVLSQVKSKESFLLNKKNVRDFLKIRSPTSLPKLICCSMQAESSFTFTTCKGFVLSLISAAHHAAGQSFSWAWPSSWFVMWLFQARIRAHKLPFHVSGYQLSSHCISRT